MKTKELVLNNNLQELGVMAETLEGLADEWGLPFALTLNLNLVLEELLTNIIFYGYEDQNPHHIHLEFTLDDQATITIRLTDDAKAFNPLLAPEPDLTASVEDRKIGGLGIHFVRKIMDQLSYQRMEGKNVLTLTKSVTPAQPDLNA